MKALVFFLMVLQDPVEETPRPQEEPREFKPPEKEVVIIGRRRESDVLDVPSGVTVITAEQIRESGQATIVEVLNKQPGFTSSGFNRGSADQVLDLRGYNNGAGNGQRTLVLVDGRKTNNVAGSFTDWATIPLDNVERIEVVRGPAAAIYGDTALAGVVNIITKKGGKDAVSTISGSGGTWSSHRVVANIAGAADDVRFDVFVGAEGTNGFRDHSAFDARNFTGRIESPLTETLQVHLKLGYHEGERERPGSLSKADIAQFGRDASVLGGSPSVNDTLEAYADIGLKQSIGDLGLLELFVNHTEQEGDTVFMSAFGDFFIDDEARITLGQLKHVVEPELFGSLATFTTGVDLSHENADGDSNFGPVTPDESEYRRRLIGAYTHVELRPADFVIVSGSVRFDRALLHLDSDPAFGGGFDRQRDFNEWSPHAGVTFKIVDEVALYGAYGQTFRFPTRDELIGFTASAPDLDPETAETYEAGARFWSGRWGSAGVTVYQSVVEDEIYFDPTFAVPPFGFGASVNFEEVTHRGVESELRFTPAEWLDVFGTHTYTSAKITESASPSMEGKRYPVTPRFQGTVGATARIEGAVLTLLGRYVGERLLISDFMNTAEHLGSYWTLDARISYTWEAAMVFISGYNLADRETFDNAGLSFSGPRFNPNAERSLLAGAEFRF